MLYSDSVTYLCIFLYVINHEEGLIRQFVIEDSHDVIRNDVLKEFGMDDFVLLGAEF